MNGLIHFIGFVLAVIGTVFLIIKACSPVKPVHIVTFSIFGAGMIFLYLTSTLYHWLPLSEKGIRLLRKADHIMIFFIIAATYTPVCAIPLKGPWGWSILSGVWLLAAAGTVTKIFWDAPRWLSTSIYLLMGWFIIVAAWPLIRTLQLEAFIWLLAGGIFYTTGALIYGIQKPDPWPPFFGFHEIFHIFVILGTSAHFILMYRYVLQFD